MLNKVTALQKQVVIIIIIFDVLNYHESHMHILHSLVTAACHAVMFFGSLCVCDGLVQSIFTFLPRLFCKGMCCRKYQCGSE